MKNSLSCFLSIALILSQVAAIPVRAEVGASDSQKRELQEALTSVTKKLPDGTRFYTDARLSQELDVKNFITDGLEQGSQEIFVPIELNEQEAVLKIVPKGLRDLDMTISVGIYLGSASESQQLLSANRILIQLGEKLETIKNQLNMDLQTLLAEAVAKLSAREKIDDRSAKQVAKKIRNLLMAAFSAMVPSASADASVESQLAQKESAKQLKRIADTVYGAFLVVAGMYFLNTFNKNRATNAEKIVAIIKAISGFTLLITGIIYARKAQ